VDLIYETDTVYYGISFDIDLIMIILATMLRYKLRAVQTETKDEIFESMGKVLMNHEQGSV
jgi:hypothetical protein